MTTTPTKAGQLEETERVQAGPGPGRGPMGGGMIGQKAHDFTPNAKRLVRRMAPWRGKVLCGEVHDDNAWAMGGVAGHAGLFGNAAAVHALLKNQVERIILTRPAVEAGEALGFLPGDLNEKILPYLRPLYDAMGDMLDAGDVAKLTEKGIIEVAPLAYMRGRTLSRSFIILDEAQNTTPEQMMMFLTRLGEDSRMVVTGDITQIDLPRAKQSGLLEVQRILRDIPGIEFHQFSGADVVRHPLVLKIIEAYERYQNPIGPDAS